MTTIFIRTIIIYIVLMLSMRLMGKRQIGELEVSDLVTTLLISEIASLPITDSSVPLLHAIIPITILMTFEIASSVIVILFPKTKYLITARPTTLIKNGKLCRKAMLACRISSDELISELRQGGYIDINDVMYAILEKNGKITIVPKPSAAPPTCEQLSIKTENEGIFHIIIDNGCINLHGLSQINMTKKQLRSKLRAEKVNASDVFLMMINDVGDTRIILKEKTG